jgi:5-methylcytosine-specific restriction endonuclease McrA
MGITDRKSKIDNINLRNKISNSLIGRYINMKNPNYKGSLDEKTIARGLCRTIGKRIIRERGKICQHCKSTENIEIHHIKPFKLIFDEFMNNYYNGNKLELYGQLMSYPDFIDESNIVVLCYNCHHDVHYTENHELSQYRWKPNSTISESATTIERVT